MKRFSYEYVKEQIESVEGFKLLSKEYKDTKTKLELRCPKGHLFTPYYLNFMSSKSCGHKECKNAKIAKSNSNSYDYVKKYIGNNGYTLLSDDYKRSTEKIELSCPKRHIFQMRYSAFHQGQRCPTCANEARKHTYNYVKGYIENVDGYKLISKTYCGALDDITIECNNNHLFDMRFNSFQQGQRCPRCSHIDGKSKPEREIDDFIRNIYKGELRENDRTTIYNPWTKCWLELDIFLPELNKAIEYNGKWYHENEYSRWKDMIKIQRCRQKGINLLVINHKDWRKKNWDMVERFISC